MEINRDLYLTRLISTESPPPQSAILKLSTARFRQSKIPEIKNPHLKNTYTNGWNAKFTWCFL